MAENEIKTTGARKKNNAENNVNNLKSTKSEISINEKVAIDKDIPENGRLSLMDIANLVNAVVETVFIERDGNIEFAAEYYEVVRAYWSMRYFYPHLINDDTGIFVFFEDYIKGVYDKELTDLIYNDYWEYADKAITEKVEIRKKQIENPVMNSITKFFNAAGILAEKYVNDIDNIGTADLKGFLKNFGKLAQNTNADKVARAVFEKQLEQEKFAKNKENLKRVE